MGCELLFGGDEWEAVQRLWMEATGEPCPCTEGRRCRMLPPDLRDLPLRVAA